MLAAVELREIVAASQEATQTRSRNRKVAVLAECLRKMTEGELAIGIGLLAGRPRQGKIGLGYAAVAEVSAAAASESTLSLDEIDRRLDEIARCSGAGATTRRRQLLGALLERATADEQQFLKHALLGAVRQGAVEGLLVEAIAAGSGVAADAVRRAVMLSGDLATVARAAFTEGEAALLRFAIQLFRPLQPMLAQPGGDIETILGELGEVELQWKLDGARVQVHKDGDRIEVYTRKLRAITPAVPEVVELVRALPARRLILDGETIALLPDGRPHAFQDTMRRFSRKRSADEMRGELPLQALFFDCLLLDDDTLLDRTTRERTLALGQAVPGNAMVPRTIVHALDEAEAFLDEALERGHEGVMVKALDAPYEAGRRGAAWRKIKPSHTLDLVVLAAEWGSGRRQGWLSNLHLGARDPEHGGFVMLGKTFKGLTDELLRWQTEAFLQREIGRDTYTVHVKPELVVEIAFDGVQFSPHYPGQMALRFARVKRYRSDKAASEADTIDRVRAIFESSRASGGPPQRL
jgi:DNA ligase-1